MVIGITGTIGAGKGTVVEYLKTKGFRHFAARDFIVEEVKRRGLPVDRDSMTAVANDLRGKHDSSYIIGELAKRAEREGGNAVVESVRTVGEAALLRERGAVLLAVDADQKLRYERITARGSVTDHVSFEVFVAQENREMENMDPAKQNIGAVMKMADYKIENNGSRSELHAHIEEVLEAVTK